MPRFMVAVYRPTGVDPAEVVTKAVAAEIDALNAEMTAAGVRVFAGGLQPTDLACCLMPPDGADRGQVSSEAGGYLRAAAFLDGFWVLETADRETALGWGRKAALACRAVVEVRPFY